MICKISSNKVIHILVLLLVIGISSSSIAQETFPLLFRCPHDEMSMSMIENNEHQFIAVGFENIKSYYDMSGRKAKIWKFGNASDSLTRIYTFNDSACCFTKIFQTEGGNYHVFGTFCIPPAYNTYSISSFELDNQLNIVQQKKIDVENLANFYAETIRKIMGNYYLFGVGHCGDTVKSFVIRLDSNLNLVRYKTFVYPAEGDGYFMDCILSPDSSKLYAVTNFPHDGKGCHFFVYDTSLNLLSIKPLPGYSNFNLHYYVDYSHNITIKNFTNNNLLIGSIMSISNNGDVETKIGFTIQDISMQWKPVHYFGSNDTSFYTTYGRPTFDFHNQDSIFFTGTKNQISSFFPSKPSWLIAGALNADLQPYFINYYGGDAYYHANSMLLTSDGGYIILADRYDKNTQGLQYDVFFLKLNNKGIITNSKPIEVCPRQDFIVSPNPFRKHFQVQLFTEQALFTIVDLSGREVYKSMLTKGMNQIDASGLNAGVYLARVKINDYRYYTEKIIKIE